MPGDKITKSKTENKKEVKYLTRLELVLLH